MMDGKLKALIVDDEERARKLLNQLLEETHFFSEVRITESSMAATNELLSFKPDMIFVDIRMPGKDGFHFVSTLGARRIKPAIVFVTAYDQYAIKAIKSHAFDYLLKPVNRKELRQCIQNYIEQRNSGNSESTKPVMESYDQISRIRINTRSGIVFINPEAILYCQADGNYTSICTGEKQHLCSMNLGKVESLLNNNGFIRIGRSLILNIKYITLLDRKDSSVTLERENDTVRVKIPRQHLKDLEKI